MGSIFDDDINALLDGDSNSRPAPSPGSRTRSVPEVTVNVPTQSQQSARPPQPNFIDSQIPETPQEAAMGMLGGLEMVGRGALSNVAGIASMPYEIPALAEFGYNYLTGDKEALQDPTLPLGAGYDFMSQYLLGDLNKVEGFEEKPWWQRGLFYAGENISGAQKWIINQAQGTAAGLIAEENMALGLGTAMLPTGRRGMPDVTTKKSKDVSKEGRELGRQLTDETGIQETEGMLLYRQALELPEGSFEQQKALQIAYETLALEEVGRKGVGPAGGANIVQWKEADRRRAVALEDTLRRIAGTSNREVKPAIIRERLAKAFNSWEESQAREFKTRTTEAFASVPKGVYFDMTGVEQKFDAIIDKYGAYLGAADDTVSTRATKARDTLRRLAARMYDADGNLTDMSTQEIQDMLSELNEISWRGNAPGLEDLSPGVLKGMARELKYAFGEVLNDAKLGPDQLEAAEALKTARQQYANDVKFLKNQNERVFIKFGIDKLDSSTPEQMLTKLKAIASDTSGETTTGQIQIVSALIQENDPTLWADIKELIFDDTFKTLRDDNGKIDFEKLKDAAYELQKNELLFGDRGQINQFKGFLGQLDGIFARYDKDIKSFADLTDYYRQVGKAGAEALGAAAGPKGRYLGELAVKIGQLLRKGKFDPKMAAYFANNQDAQIALTKSLKGEFKQLTNAQIRALQTAGLIAKVYTTVGIPAMYIGRSENNQTDLSILSR